MNYPASFQKLIELLRLLPSVGEKTAERYAFTIYNMDEEKLKELSSIILNLKKLVKTCDRCGCLSDTDECQNCGKKTNIICVVENQKSVFVFRKLGFNDLSYHVLGGLISPMEGINPEDIAINKLINRIKEEQTSEVILALNPGIEGSTTSLYIKKLLEKEKVKITEVAHGIPMGTDLEYLDNLTLEMAINNRS